MNLFWSAVGVFVLTGVWLGLLYRRYKRQLDPPSSDDLSPRWRNEHVYRDGRHGQDGE